VLTSSLRGGQSEQPYYTYTLVFGVVIHVFRTRSITTLKISINEIGVKIVYWVFVLQIKNYLVGAPTGRDKYYKQSSTYSNKWSRISFHTVQMINKQLLRESFLLCSIFILTMDPTFSSILYHITYHINTLLVQLNCDNIIYIFWKIGSITVAYTLIN